MEQILEFTQTPYFPIIVIALVAIGVILAIKKLIAGAVTIAVIVVVAMVLGLTTPEKLGKQVNTTVEQTQKTLKEVEDTANQAKDTVNEVTDTVKKKAKKKK